MNTRQRLPHQLIVKRGEMWILRGKETYFFHNGERWTLGVGKNLYFFNAGKIFCYQHRGKGGFWGENIFFLQNGEMNSVGKCSIFWILGGKGWRWRWHGGESRFNLKFAFKCFNGCVQVLMCKNRKDRVKKVCPGKDHCQNGKTLFFSSSESEQDERFW